MIILDTWRALNQFADRTITGHFVWSGRHDNAAGNIAYAALRNPLTAPATQRWIHVIRARSRVEHSTQSAAGLTIAAMRRSVAFTVTDTVGTALADADFTNMDLSGTPSTLVGRLGAGATISGGTRPVTGSAFATAMAAQPAADTALSDPPQAWGEGLWVAKVAPLLIQGDMGVVWARETGSVDGGNTARVQMEFEWVESVANPR